MRIILTLSKKSDNNLIKKKPLML